MTRNLPSLPVWQTQRLKRTIQQSLLWTPRPRQHRQLLGLINYTSNMWMGWLQVLFPTPTKKERPAWGPWPLRNFHLSFQCQEEFQREITPPTCSSELRHRWPVSQWGGVILWEHELEWQWIRYWWRRSDSPNSLCTPQETRWPRLTRTGSQRQRLWSPTRLFLHQVHSCGA